MMGNFLQQLKGDLICRPDVSQKVIDAFADIVDKQDEKGLKKYGVSIDHAEDKDWDWNEMALEEAADLFKYLVKENIRLRKELERSKQNGGGS